MERRKCGFRVAIERAKAFAGPLESTIDAYLFDFIEKTGLIFRRGALLRVLRRHDRFALRLRGSDFDLPTGFGA
jgi:hypothetical protein